MQITQLDWSQEAVWHIARHRVAPEDIEEACFSHGPLIERGRGGLYYVSGTTSAGRDLFIVIRALGHGKAKVITARDMDHRERRRYHERRR
jgi:uncharacterized DUF497 family protein